MSVRGRQDLEIQGPRLNNTKEEKTSIKYGPDRRLDPIITEEMPLLEVFHFLKFHGLNSCLIPYSSIFAKPTKMAYRLINTAPM